jgi:Alkylmercury lyase
VTTTTPADFDTAVKLAVYGTFAATGTAPAIADVAARVGAAREAVREAYARLAAVRLLTLEPDGVSIRMAPPFSGVPTPHEVTADGVRYFANCAWDALGIPAALHRPGQVASRCEQTLEPLNLAVGVDGPPPSPWIFHSLVPTARWSQDIVFT